MKIELKASICFHKNHVTVWASAKPTHPCTSRMVTVRMFSTNPPQHANQPKRRNQYPRSICPACCLTLSQEYCWIKSTAWWQSSISAVRAHVVTARLKPALPKLWCADERNELQILEFPFSWILALRLPGSSLLKNYTSTNKIFEKKLFTFCRWFCN